MKKIYITLIVLFVTAIQAQGLDAFQQEGIASWYGREFEGRPTASGEIFDSSQLTAAHPNLPFGTVIIVTNLHNNKSVTVRVNDRGPFVPARIIDVSRAAAEQIDMIVTGTAPVKIETTDKIVLSTTAVGANSNAPHHDVMPVYVSQPMVMQSPVQFRTTPAINITPEKKYRLQIGSYRVARNAVETFDRLKNAGLDPAYERFTDGADIEYFRVVLAGVPGSDVQTTSDKLSAAGFREAIIREEN